MVRWAGRGWVRTSALMMLKLQGNHKHNYRNSPTLRFSLGLVFHLAAHSPPRPAIADREYCLGGDRSSSYFMPVWISSFCYLPTSVCSFFFTHSFLLLLLLFFLYACTSTTLSSSIYRKHITSRHGKTHMKPRTKSAHQSKASKYVRIRARQRKLEDDAGEMQASRRASIQLAVPMRTKTCEKRTDLYKRKMFFFVLVGALGISQVASFAPTIVGSLSASLAIFVLAW